MKVVTLASSSKGNCILVFNDETKILIDIGISISELETKLNMLGISPHEISAILNTHEHIDHTKNIGASCGNLNALTTILSISNGISTNLTILS